MIAPWWGIAVCAASVGLSFFLSGMEAGVLALNPVRIRHWMRTGKPRAARLHRFLEHQENFVWTILVGNTFANFIVVSSVVWLLFTLWGDRPGLALSVFLGLMFLFYITCDLLPKMLFRAFPNRLCLSLVGPFRLVHALLRPVVNPVEYLAGRLMSWIGSPAYRNRFFSSREELRTALQESGPALTQEERAMISRVFEFASRPIRDFMVPMARVVAVSLDTPRDEILRLCREHHLARLPVWRQEGGRSRIAGVVSLRHVLYLPDSSAPQTAADLLKPALYLAQETSGEDALRRMQRAGQRFAIVLGGTQQEIGVVSVEDLLRFLFGALAL